MTDKTTTPIDQLGGGQVSLTTQIGPWAFVPMWINDVGLSDSEYRIYVALRSYADRAGTCWPLARTIAKDAGKSLGTVRNAIQRFRKLGLLTTRPRHRDDGGLAGVIYTLTDLRPARTAHNGTDQHSPAPPLHPPVHPPYIPQWTQEHTNEHTRGTKIYPSLVGTPSAARPGPGAGQAGARRR